AAELKRMYALAGERVLHLDLPLAAQREVAAAVDHQPGVAGEALCRRVGGEPLARASGVEEHTRRPPHHAAWVVDFDLAPGGAWIRRRRPPRRRLRERLRERNRD